MTKNIIEFSHVSFTYNEAKEKAINDLSFNVQQGDWFSILGPNGSGKSTITKLIDGLLEKDNDNGSKIFIDGDELNLDNLWKIRSKIGIVFQNPDNQFVGATVGDDVAFGLENLGIPRSEMIPKVEQALKAVGMYDYIASEPSNLSGGQKQRVAIAGILAIEPKILILDEATSMLDPQGQKDILKLVENIKNKRELTVIAITHNIDEVMLANQILLIKNGQKLRQDSPARIFNDTDLIKKTGIDQPFIFKLKNKLIQAGLDLNPNIDSEKQLIEALCQLNSSM